MRIFLLETVKLDHTEYLGQCEYDLPKADAMFLIEQRKAVEIRPGHGIKKRRAQKELPRQHAPVETLRADNAYRLQLLKDQLYQLELDELAELRKYKPTTEALLAEKLLKDKGVIKDCLEIRKTIGIKILKNDRSGSVIENVSPIAVSAAIHELRRKHKLSPWSQKYLEHYFHFGEPDPHLLMVKPAIIFALDAATGAPIILLQIDGSTSSDDTRDRWKIVKHLQKQLLDYKSRATPRTSTPIQKRAYELLDNYNANKAAGQTVNFGKDVLNVINNEFPKRGLLKHEVEQMSRRYEEYITGWL